MKLTRDSILNIRAQGAWNGGTAVDNTCYENRGMTFKNNIPVTGRTIEERIGVRTRIAAPEDARIGVLAMENLLETSGIDPKRIRLLIGATNVGEDKFDAGPLIRYPLECIARRHPQIDVLDLYAGCPGFNVAVELIFMLSMGGILEPGDISVIVGAENIHRARAFKPHDTSNIIFGDDAAATALETTEEIRPEGTVYEGGRLDVQLDRGPDLVPQIAEAIHRVTGDLRIDGLIIDNQLGILECRVPATAARVQHRLVELMHPEAAATGTFHRFKDTLKFYGEKVRSFAFDIMSMTRDAAFVETVAGAYVRSGKYDRVVSARLSSDLELTVALHLGDGFRFQPPRTGIVDTATTTVGCFADYIQGVRDEDGVFGEMNGKGVFLYATRGAGQHLAQLLSPHGLTLKGIDLLIEHQANFAMIPLTLEQVMADGKTDLKGTVADYIANRMLTNVHVRGNCSVVCMQRLPYDLARGALEPDTIQGFPVNRNLEGLKSAKTVLYDSVGAGMTRSSFLQRKM